MHCKLDPECGGLGDGTFKRWAGLNSRELAYHSVLSTLGRELCPHAWLVLYHRNGFHKMEMEPV